MGCSPDVLQPRTLTWSWPPRLDWGGASSCRHNLKLLLPLSVDSGGPSSCLPDLGSRVALAGWACREPAHVYSWPASWTWGLQEKVLVTLGCTPESGQQRVLRALS